MKTVRIAVLGLGALALAGSLSAQEVALELDPAQTRIEFLLRGALHDVHGSFQLKSGAVRFDPSAGRVSGKVVVDATNGDSGSQGRDRKMHKDVLESRQYPEVTFTPGRVEGQVAAGGESTVQVQGVFSIHGAVHDITLPVLVNATGDQWIATAHFVVPYAQWGLKNPSMFLLKVSEKVEIEVRVVGRVTGLAPHRSLP